MEPHDLTLFLLSSRKNEETSPHVTTAKNASTPNTLMVAIATVDEISFPFILREEASGYVIFFVLLALIDPSNKFRLLLVLLIRAKPVRF